MSAPRLADPGARLLAKGVDTLLAWLGGLAGSVVGAGLVAAFGTFDHAASFTNGMMGAGLLAVVSAQWWLIARDGQTVGKRWLDIRIERMNGSLPGFVAGVVIRGWLAFLFKSMCGLLGVIDVIAIFRSDRRTIHDHIAGTRVVRVDLPTPTVADGDESGWWAAARRERHG